MYWALGIIIFSLSGSAFGQANNLQLTKLYCSLREGKFLTHLEFRNQQSGDHPVLAGEVSNYLVQNDGTKKYISGFLFTHIRYNNQRVAGDTGDPSDLIGMFVLTRLDAQFAGRWSYWFRRSQSEIVKGTFNCSYNDLPPSLRWDRRPYRVKDGTVGPF